jgi:hypothetical protein
VKKAIAQGIPPEIKGELRVKKGEISSTEEDYLLLNSPFLTLSELTETIAAQANSPNSLNSPLVSMSERTKPTTVRACRGSLEIEPHKGTQSLEKQVVSLPES